MARTRSTFLTCTNCEATADLPEDRNHSGLWDAGWRWIGTRNLYSCPGCPPAIVVTQDGRQQTGPAAMRTS